MKINIKRFAMAVIVIVCMVLIDQYSKNFFISYLKKQPGYLLKFNSFFDIVYSWNYGISMGFFNQHQKYSNIIFLILNSTIILYLFITYVVDVNAPKFYLMVIGGGGGNLFDRFTKGAVFDFISIHYKEYYFPAFNLADAFITMAILMLVWEIYLKKKL